MEDLDAIIISAEQMEESGKVDNSIIPLIQRAIEEASKKEQESRRLTTSREDAFVKFHAWRNISNILKNIRDRFEKVSPADNPKVAEDTLRAIPEIQILEGILLSVDRASTTSQSRQLVLDRVSQLRDTARIRNLLPNPENEVEQATSALKKDLANFVDRVGTILK